MKNTLISTLVATLCGCASTTTPVSSRPIWEIEAADTARRAQILGPQSIKPAQQTFPASNPVWSGSRPN